MAIQTPTSPMDWANQKASGSRTIHMLARFMALGTRVSADPRKQP